MSLIRVEFHVKYTSKRARCSLSSPIDCRRVSVFGCWSQEDLYLFLFILTCIFLSLCLASRHMCAFSQGWSCIIWCVCPHIVLRQIQPHTPIIVSYLICSLQWADVRNCSSTYENNWKFRDMFSSIDACYINIVVTGTTRKDNNNNKTIPSNSTWKSFCVSSTFLHLNVEFHYYFHGPHRNTHTMCVCVGINQRARERDETTKNCSRGQMMLSVCHVRPDTTTQHKTECAVRLLL